MNMQQKKKDYCTPSIEIIRGAYAECLPLEIGSEIHHVVEQNDILVDVYEEDETVEMTYLIEFMSAAPHINIWDE